MAAIQDESVGSPPTEDQPQLGTAGLLDVELSAAEYWIDEDGDHVIRSLEFDVIAGAPTFDEALAQFIGKIADFAVYLGELENPGENEEEMFHRLAPRLARVARAMDKVESLGPRRTGGLIGRRRRKVGHHVRAWHQLSKPHGSSVPSPA